MTITRSTTSPGSYPCCSGYVPTRSAKSLDPFAGLVLVLIVGLAWALGPNQMGPIRWTLRAMPLVVLCAVVLTIVLIARARAPRPTLRDLAIAMTFSACISYMLISRFWSQGTMMAISGMVLMLGVVISWLLLRHANRSNRRRQRQLALFMVIWSVGVVALQHAYFPNAPSVDRDMPGNIDGYTTQASAARGDTVVVGDTNRAVIRDPNSIDDFVVRAARGT